MNNSLLNDFREGVNYLLQEKDEINIAIATGKTLEYFISSLQYVELQYDRINLFVVDEFASIGHLDPRSCTIDLLQLLGIRAFDFKSINCFSDVFYHRNLDEYNQRLSIQGLDICVLGVGEDGHVGFCYPPISLCGNSFYELFELPIERKCEHIQKGWFESIESMPSQVISLTLWGIMQSRMIFIAANYEEKRNIISQMINPTLHFSACPVLYLLNHQHTNLYFA